MVKEISSIEEFDALIKDKDVLVDFFATWCPHCTRESVVIDKVDAKYKDQFNILKVDVDKFPDLAQKYDVEAMPTLVILSNGTMTNTHVGELDESGLVEFLS